jgi:hypothetical protein
MPGQMNIADELKTLADMCHDKKLKDHINRLIGVVSAKTHSKGKPPLEFTYTYKDLQALTDWPYGRLKRDVSDGALEPGSLESIVRWAAKNAKPSLQFQMLVNIMSSIELPSAAVLRVVFEESAKQRKSVAKKRGRRS